MEDCRRFDILYTNDFRKFRVEKNPVRHASERVKGYSGFTDFIKNQSIGVA